jgi:hypothetical protein
VITIRRKFLSIVLALALSMIVMALAPTVSAKTLKCEQVIVYNDYGVSGPHPDHVGETAYWKGTTTGALTGTVYFWEKMCDPYIVGKVMHFSEDFYISLGDGEWVSGYDKGVWNFATLKFRATGWVTDASENCEYLIGSKFHEEGFTTNPDILPIIGTGTCFIGP